MGQKIRNPYINQPVERVDPFDGRLEEAKSALNAALHMPFTGTVWDALHLGNTITLALQVLEGRCETFSDSVRIEFAEENH